MHGMSSFMHKCFELHFHHFELHFHHKSIVKWCWVGRNYIGIQCHDSVRPTLDKDIDFCRRCELKEGEVLRMGQLLEESPNRHIKGLTSLIQDFCFLLIQQNIQRLIK